MKRLIIVLILVFASKAQSQSVAFPILSSAVAAGAAAITFEGADSSHVTAFAGATTTLTHTVSATANSYTLFGISGYSSLTYSIDSVLVDGTGGGKLDSLANGGTNSTNRCLMFGRKAVQAGSRTFTIYFKTGANKSFAFIAATFAGIDQSTPVVSSAGAIDYSNPYTRAITCGTDSVTVDVTFSSSIAGGITCDASQTQIHQLLAPYTTAMSYRIGTGTVMTWTGAAGNLAIAAVVLKRN